MGPYSILRQVGNMAYELELTLSLGSIHPVFYVLMLNKSVGDPSLVVPLECIGVSVSLSCKEAPIEYLDQQVHWFWTKDVDSVKIQWRNQSVKKLLGKMKRT